MQDPSSPYDPEPHSLCVATHPELPIAVHLSAVLHPTCDRLLFALGATPWLPILHHRAMATIAIAPATLVPVTFSSLSPRCLTWVIFGDEKRPLPDLRP